MNSEPSSKETTPEQSAAKIMETVPVVMRFIRTEMRSQSSSFLSVPQFRTLAFLDRNPGCSLSDVAEHLGVTRATASAMTERLVQRNLVERIENPEERRRVILNLTQEGTHHLQQSREVTRTKIANMLVNLTEEQFLSVVEGIAVLSHLFEDTASTPSQKPKT